MQSPGLSLQFTFEKHFIDILLPSKKYLRQISLYLSFFEHLDNENRVGTSSYKAEK